MLIVVLNQERWILMICCLKPMNYRFPEVLAKYQNRFRYIL
jgi:hypothetical protein